MTAGTASRLGRGLAAAALLIGAVTVLARVLGFGRWLVFSRTVEAECLRDAYNTANMVPNIVFEIVAGGALAGAVVPLLAGPLARGARDEAGRTLSALLCWTLLVLVPVAAVGMLAAPPAAAALLDRLGAGGGCGTEYGTVVGRMLLVFLPQVPLYGVAVVLSAALQADRRFLAPATAPLLSSVVVIGAYLSFAAVVPGDGDLGSLPPGPELVLSLGTTAGVLVLAAALIPALRRAGLPLRPTLALPPAVAARARALALAGLATVVAQQVATLTVLLLANSRYGARGAITVYNYTWAVYLLPYAVLAVPIATSAFTALAAQIDAGDRDGYAATVAATTRAVLLVSWAGAAVLAAVAVPVARLFLAATDSTYPPSAMAYALVAFAAGLVGFGLIAHLGRALYAAGAGRAAARAIVAGWAGVVVADLILVIALPPRLTVAAFGWANTAGMLLAGGLLLAAARRAAGAGALAGVGRAAAAGLAGAVAAAGVGTLVARAFGPVGPYPSAAVAAVAGTVAVVVFAGIVLLVDGADMRLILKRRFSRA